MKTDFLLDADETILDFVRSSRECFGAAMEDAGLAPLASRYDEFKQINDGVWREYERGEIAKSALVLARFERFFARCGVQADARAVNERYFGRLCRTGYLLGGAREFLDELKRRGRVWLITNGTPAAQYGRLEAVGLQNFFDGVFVSDEIGFAKPDRRFFEYALARIGAPREACLVIGDSLSSDIAGANNAGIECIWYNAAGKEPVGARPDHTARTYAEILRIIDQRP